MSGRMIKSMVLRPIRMVIHRFRKLTNVKNFIRKFLKNLFKTIFSYIKLKPKSMDDYVEFRSRYVAKSLLLLIVLLMVSLPICFFVFVQPYLEERYLVTTFLSNDEKVATHTGKVKIVDEKDNSILFLGKLLDGTKTETGTSYNNEGDLVYSGTYENGMYQGMGSLYEKNVKVYEGAFVAGLPEGEGVLFDSEGSVQYRGAFVLGNPEGSGALFHKNGNIKYKGEFFAGLPDGNGIEYFDTGVIKYEGQFSTDQYTGNGKLYNEAGELVYDGEFNLNAFDGQGKYYDKELNRIYEGQFSDNHFSGSGKLFENNVLLYEGEFQNDKFFGEGKLFSQNVLKYEGSFIEGKKEGMGQAYSDIGKVLYNGRFTNDDIDYLSILGEKIQDVSQLFSDKAKYVYLEDDNGYVFYCEDSGIYIFFNFMDEENDSVALNIFLQGDRSVQNVMLKSNKNAYSYIKEILGDPVFEYTMGSNNIFSVVNEGYTNNYFAMEYYFNGYSYIYTLSADKEKILFVEVEEK